MDQIQRWIRSNKPGKPKR